MRNLIKVTFAVITISILFLFLTGCPLPITHRVTASSAPPGMEIVINNVSYTLADQISVRFREGERVEFSVGENYGYEFDHWRVNGESYAYPSIYFNIYEDTNVQAHFRELQSATISGQLEPYTGKVTSAAASGFRDSSKIFDGVETSWNASEDDYIPGEYVLIIDPDYDLSYFENDMIKALSDQIEYRVDIKRAVETEDGSMKFVVVEAEEGSYNWLKELPGVLSVERNYLFRLQYDSQIYPVRVPDDEFYDLQWGLPMINLPRAWLETTGSQTVVVAVIDSGVDFGHSDLDGVFYSTGWNFIGNDGFPQDDTGHGTHVSGTIAALTDNETGVAGVVWGGDNGVRILPIKVDGPNGISVSDLAEAIIYAVEHGARIINLSLGGYGNHSPVAGAVNYAYKNDVVIIAAAGNDGIEQIMYPAAYPQVIAVGAVGPTQEKASYSNYGPGLDVVAPGGDRKLRYRTEDKILSTGWLKDQSNIYVYMEGTSMATPHVTGVVALLMSKGVAGVERIRSILQLSAKDLGDSEKYGYGLVDAYEALRTAGLTAPFEVFVYDIHNDYLQSVQADEYGRFEFTEIHGREVIIFAWKDNDMDEDFSTGDLFGYYRYEGGNPLDWDPLVVTTQEGGNYVKDFKFAPIVDTAFRTNEHLQQIKKIIRTR